MFANESTFCLDKIIKSNIESFIRYYSVKELSEDNETDFEDDGLTAKSESIDITTSQECEPQEIDSPTLPRRKSLFHK
jgi:hypothetical protein